MKKTKQPRWIKHSHFNGSEDFECSECGKRFKRKSQVCPNCGAHLRRTDDDLGWIDELEALDTILDED